jgi:hypothetical protein
LILLSKNTSEIPVRIYITDFTYFIELAFLNRFVENKNKTGYRFVGNQSLVDVRWLELAVVFGLLNRLAVEDKSFFRILFQPGRDCPA